MNRWICVLLCAGIMAGAPGDVRAYDVVGVFLNFPQGVLDDVTRINVSVASNPFGVSQISPYPPAYKTENTYIASIFPEFATMEYDDYQGALGSDWHRLTYANGTQSYGSSTDTPPADLLQSENSTSPGTPVIVDGYGLRILSGYFRCGTCGM